MDKIRTLIVDDNHLFKESLISFFADHGEIELVGSVTEGQECLDFIQCTPVDLVIMDVRMSGMDGPHTTTIIKQKYPDIKIIMCTVWSRQLIRKNKEHIGTDDFFTKGEPLGQLLTHIHTLFGL